MSGRRPKNPFDRSSNSKKTPKNPFGGQGVSNNPFETSSTNPFDENEPLVHESQRICPFAADGAGVGNDASAYATPKRRVGDAGGSAVSSGSKGGSAAPSSSSVTTNHTIDTNMLLQSAARSVLDTTSPATSTPISDDGSEFSSPAPTLKNGPHPKSINNFKHSSRAEESASLQSLQTETLPPMPDEQDRKRFIGCLAAVLASSYSYDIVDECDDMSEAFRAESMAYLDAADDDFEDTKDRGKGTVAGDGTVLEGGDDERVLSHAISNGGSFDYPESDALLFESNTMASSSSTIRRAPASNNTHGLSNRASKELHRIRLSRARHRKRRYDVLSKFLTDSASYLFLEKGQAKAFLPMLTKLLVPQPQPKKSIVGPSASASSKNPLQWGRKPSSVQPSSGNSVATDTTELSDSQHSFGNNYDSGNDNTSPSDKILSQISEAPVHDFPPEPIDIFEREVDEIEHFRPFLESMTPGGGFRCLALVLLQHLLHSKEGYDARVRNSVKRLGVLLLVHEMRNDPTQIEVVRSGEGGQLHQSQAAATGVDLVELATRRFESLEHELAARIIKLSRDQQQQPGTSSARASQQQMEEAAPKGITRQQVMRGLKVGAVGVAAASLFAVTGGLAAPGIAAGVAAIAGGTAATAAAAAVLTSTAAVTAIFGVGGGTLVAYKMNRRTLGVTEFEFRKETGSKTSHSLANQGDEASQEIVEAELFSTISISGWLRDFCDFQRPWGVSPSNPWISDPVELLERFYAVYRPENILKSEKILKSWEGEERELWNLLRQKYGTDPDHLYPLLDGPRQGASLTLEQREIVDQLLVEMGYNKKKEHKKATLSSFRGGWKRRQGKHNTKSDRNQSATSESSVARDQSIPFDSNGSKYANKEINGSAAGASTVSSLGFESISTSLPTNPSDKSEEQEELEMPKHIATVWDYQANYGGELYTIRWESEMLKELCDSVSDLAFDLVSGGTAQILKHTALSALMSAVAWPYALVNAANMIDGTWTLAVERADEAGRELARSLLFSRAGHRPVTLVGFSFGGRAIYSCLKELAKYQEKWCDYQEKTAANPNKAGHPDDDDDNEDGESFRNMREPASIVEDAIMMGVPNHLSLPSWRACRQVVAGRLVNCFSQKDLILSLMFQFKRLKLKPVCGTCPVAVSGVENIDVTELVSGHEQYCIVTGDLLKKVRHGQPFRSRPARLFEPATSVREDCTEEDPLLTKNKFDL